MKTSRRKSVPEDLSALAQRREELLRELFACGDWIRGSLVETTRLTKKGSRSKEKGGMATTVFRYLSRSERGRNRITYVKEEEIGSFVEAIGEYEKASALTREISELNVRILKAGGTMNRTRASERKGEGL